MLRLIAVGKVREPYLREGISEYVKRIPRSARLEVVEVADRSVAEEGERIVKVAGDDFLVALDVEGAMYSSTDLADLIKDKTASGQTVSFVIGGPEGLSREVLEKADLRMSLSRMTFTHEMCRLFLMEQIYRAFTIIDGRSYHK